MLLRAGWVTPGTGVRAGNDTAALHPDVRFSLALDEGYVSRPAAAVARERPTRKQLPWLKDTDPED
jgi:hypothetical protein